MKWLYYSLIGLTCLFASLPVVAENTDISVQKPQSFTYFLAFDKAKIKPIKSSRPGEYFGDIVEFYVDSYSKEKPLISAKPQGAFFDKDKFAKSFSDRFANIWIGNRNAGIQNSKNTADALQCIDCKEQEAIIKKIANDPHAPTYGLHYIGGFEAQKAAPSGDMDKDSFYPGMRWTLSRGRCGADQGMAIHAIMPVRYKAGNEPISPFGHAYGNEIFIFESKNQAKQYVCGRPIFDKQCLVCEDCQSASLGDRINNLSNSKPRK